MTYTIHRRNDVGPDEPRYIRTLGRYLPLLSKPIIFNWAITQQDNIKAQLNGGIRYLDLRVATKPSDGDIYFLHGLYGSKIYEPLQQVAEWLSSHSNEIIILDFQHFYSFSDEDHRRLVDTIFRIFQRKLCPLSYSFDHVTLHRLNLEKYQVIVIYRNVFAQNNLNLWLSGLWRTLWPNTVRVNELTDFLDRSRTADTPHGNRFRVAMCSNTRRTLRIEAFLRNASKGFSVSEPKGNYFLDR